MAKAKRTISIICALVFLMRDRILSTNRKSALSSQTGDRVSQVMRSQNKIKRDFRD
ncbi:hypothetical protein [Spirulina sp. 06S082]|uniref:hypothetical protein n=1 Tax=Spirulina sp. 06S082 TaxID=3110248 RepID=UPI002B1FD21E|nr:hypothetical protein [Spirulina sp. 06S082]